MAEYRYDSVIINDLPTVATRIARAVGVTPTGMMDSGDTTVVQFASALTAPQKTSLDAFMAGSNLDSIPVTANTIYEFSSLEGIKVTTGIDFDVYLLPNYVQRCVFFKALTNAEKNAIKSALANSFVLVQG